MPYYILSMYDKNEALCLLAKLSSHFKRLVRVGRIELPSSAWKADVLPLNDTRNSACKYSKKHKFFNTLILPKYYKLKIVF